MRRLRLQLRTPARAALALLNVIPLPGLGAIIAGWRNPHTRLLPHGIAQATLFLLGTYPLIVPGAIGFLWALTDATRIAQAESAPLPPEGPTPLR